MPRLLRTSGHEAIQAYNGLGFEFVAQKGSHVVLKKQTLDRAVGCTVPLSRQLGVGTLGGILRLSQVTLEEFLENL